MNKAFRSQFPALKRKVKGKPCIFLDGPAGTQVPEYVIRAISQYYRRSNANSHGVFTTTKETDKLLHDTRSIVATFLGAAGPHNISFGQNMTTLTYSLARAIGRYLLPGDEILITQLDHEANRGPWLSLKDEGIEVREVKILENGTLDYEDFENKINEHTKLVCMGLASNLTGVVNDVNKIRKLAHQAGAWMLLDAVHYAPHFRVDVSSIGCDFLICSAYKFYGPHVGLLYARTDLLDQLPTDRLRTTEQHAPYSLETGTLNHAAIAGVNAAIEFISNQGEGDNIKSKLDTAMQRIGVHERKLAQMLYDGINNSPKLDLVGPDFGSEERAPTLSFVHEDLSALEVCERLAEHNIFAWGGHFYAIRAVEILGLLERGGVTRMGISAYTSEEDVERTLYYLEKIQG